MKVPLGFVKFLLLAERIIVGLAFVVLLGLMIFSNFVEMAFLKVNSNIAILILVGILFLAGFIHTMFEYYNKRESCLKALGSSDDIKYFFSKMLDDVREELYATHILALPFKEDKVLNCAEKNESLKKKVRISRIVAIQNQEDLKVADATLQKIKSLEHVDIDLTIINPNTTKLLLDIPNVVIKDNEEALLIFPSRLEGKTRGLYMRDKIAAGDVLRNYWLKIKNVGSPATEVLLREIEREIKDGEQTR